jgi:hypothetical protein
MNIVHWQPGSSKRTDRHDKANDHS